MLPLRLTPGPPSDALVLGPGPAAAAAALVLSRLGRSTALVTPEGGPPAPWLVLLPESALAALRFLGLEEEITRRGWPMASRQVRWGWIDDHGPGTTALAVEEADLETVLHTAATRAGTRDVALPEPWALDREGGAWVLRGGGAVSPALLAEAPWVVRAAGRWRPQGAPDDTRGPVDRVLMGRRRSPVRAPRGLAHAVASGTDAWSWTLSDEEGPLQVAVFTAADDPRPRDVRLRAGGAACDAVEDTFDWAERQVGMYLPPRSGGDGTVTAGAAAFRASPLSSLGTTHALQGARRAAVVVHELLRGEFPAERVLEAAHREDSREALRTVALLARDCEPLAARTGDPFWTQRSDASWAFTQVPPSEADAARRWMDLVSLQSGGTLFQARLRARPAQPTETLVFRGPRLVWAGARAAAGGLPVDDGEWHRLAPLWTAFGTGCDIASALERAGAVGPPADERTWAQRTFRLVELGLLERAP